MFGFTHPTLAEAEATQTVVVIGERQQVTLDPQNLPAAVTTIEAEDVLATNIGRDISNIFRRVPGVLANNLDQGDTGNGFRMRGFATQGTHGADTAVYVDGVPQNLPSSEAGAGHGPAFLEWLSPAMISKVDVIKGPISALHGDQNRAGAVNIHLAPENVGSSISAAAESFKGRRGTLVVSETLSGFEHFFVADHYDAEGFRDSAENKRTNLLWKGSSVLAEGLYSLSLNHYSSEFIAAGYLSYSRLREGEVAPSALQENALPGFGKNTQSGITFNRRPANSESGLYLTFYGMDIERQRAAAGGGLLHNVGEDDRKVFGGRAAYNFTAGEGTAIILGTDFRQDRGDAVRERYDDYQPTGNFLTNLKLDLWTYGLFVQAQQRFLENWKVLAGLRYDYLDYDVINRKFTDADLTYGDGVTTAKLGLVWSPSSTLELFTNVAEGFRSPAAQQVSPGGSLAPLGQEGGVTNKDIGASKVRSYDLGLVVAPLDALKLAASLYYIENEDEIAQTAPDTFSSVGESTRKGFELETQLQLADNLSLYANFGRVLEATLTLPTASGGQSISVPKTIAKAGTAYVTPLGQGEFALNADAFVISGIPYYNGSPAVRLEMPTFTRYDLRGRYRVSNVELSLYWTWQPHPFASEAAYATANDLMISTQPKHFGGAGVLYRF